LSKRCALLMLRRFDHSPFTFAMGMMLTGAFATVWMPNQATTAMLFPIAMEVAAALHLKPKESEYGKLLFFSMAWGAMVGGNLSFLGSSRAALSLGMLQKSYGIGIGFAQWMVAAAPVVVLGLITTPLVLRAVIRPEPVDFGAARRVIERAVENLGPMRRPQYHALAIIPSPSAWVSVGGRRVDLAVIGLLVRRGLQGAHVGAAERHVYWNIVDVRRAIALGSALDKTGAARWLPQGAGRLPAVGDARTSSAPPCWRCSCPEVMSNAAALAVVLPLAFTLAAQSGRRPSPSCCGVVLGRPRLHVPDEHGAEHDYLRLRVPQDV
jgi:sodium-dependent dicarboxylate transporter 2/3/5